MPTRLQSTAACRAVAMRAGAGALRMRQAARWRSAACSPRRRALAENWQISRIGRRYRNLHQQRQLFAPSGQADSDFVTSLTAALDDQRRRARGSSSTARSARPRILYAERDRRTTASRPPSICPAASRRSRISSSSTRRPTSARPFSSPFGAAARQHRQRDRTIATRSRPIRSAPTSRACFGAIEHLLSGARRQLSGRSRASSAIRRPTCRTPTRTACTRIDELAGEPVGMDARVQPVLLRQRRRDDGDIGNGNSYTIQIGARDRCPTRSTRSCRSRCAAGYENDQFPLTELAASAIYGAGVQWNPTDRTQVGGFWEHRFFGSSYSVQISHRLPECRDQRQLRRAASPPIRSSRCPFRRAPTVTQFVDAAFTTRIPDPAERALAVEQFLAQDRAAADAGELR